jgi:hypothetical protein
LSASGTEFRYRSIALECRMATEFEKRDQQSEIKQLITKGKEQGYLTYAEVNDHLPDDIVDPEQIEDIIGMINDMGIEVHETAPDAESLLLQETPAAQDDETATEEAIQALSAVEETGRTTDPVRMYMREMGTVELLTREGEIAIAKRIEEGLAQVQNALAQFPWSVSLLLEEYESHLDGKKRMSEFLTGFYDLEAAAAEAAAALTEEMLESEEEGSGPTKDVDDESDGDGEESTPGDTGPDQAEVKRRMELFGDLYEKFKAAHAKVGPEDKKTLKLRKQIQEEFLRDQGHQPPHVDRRSQGTPREEGNGRGQPASRDLDRQEVHQPRPAVPRPDPGRQHRPDEGGRQVRIPPRLQVLDLRHLVDPPGHHPLDRRPGAHHPHSGAHDRDDQQAQPHLAPDAAGEWAASRRRKSWPKRMEMPKTRSARC